MDPIELENQTEEIARGPGNRFNQIVATTVAVTAVFMALCKVKDDNIVQAMMAAQTRELDHWSQYQAKSIKENLQLTQIEHWKLAAVTTLAKQAIPPVEAKIKTWETEAQRYHAEKEELKAKAESAHAEYDRLNIRDDQFDFSDALLGLAIALFAISTLAQSRVLYGFGLAILAVAVLMGFAGFMEWPIHPGIIKFLT